MQGPCPNDEYAVVCEYYLHARIVLNRYAPITVTLAKVVSSIIRRMIADNSSLRIVWSNIEFHSPETRLVPARAAIIHYGRYASRI